MAYGYSLSLATAGNSTTSGTPATEVDHVFIKPGATKTTGMVAFDVIGKGAGLTTLSGISFRMARLATASTSGTGITPALKESGQPTAVTTSASLPTIGATRTNRWVVGCGAAGPGGWWAKNEYMVEKLPGGSAASYDILSASGTASLVFDWGLEIAEY